MIIAVVFIVALALGIPIAWMLGMCGVSYIFSMDPALIIVLPQKMLGSAANYGLLCIPMFILAGELMALSGDVNRLMDLARVFVGHIKGGLCYVTIMVGTMLGASLGSAIAEAALLGATLYPELRKDGYEEEFSANLIGATSIIGPIIPPGMPYIIYGVVANVSIKKLFIAGIMPGIYMALALSVTIFLLGLKRDWKKRKRVSIKEMFTALRRAAFSLLTPALALISIATGIATPTEAAAVLSMLILIVGIFVYKKIKIKDLPPIFIKAGVTSVAILLISDMAGLFGFALAYNQIPQHIATAVTSFSSNPYVILLMINVLFLFVGMIMEPLPAQYILVPVMIPIMERVGLDPIHIGMVLCLNLMIGLLTPPVGSALYTTAMATGVSPNKMIKTIWPWCGVLIVVLFFITYVPQSFMWLVKLVG
jgi:tripartite ATP-independent transporter DctM subunit